MASMAPRDDDRKVGGTITLNGTPAGMVTLKGVTFGTGSQGWFGQGKVDLGDGSVLQVQVQAVIIGTKPSA